MVFRAPSAPAGRVPAGSFLFSGSREAVRTQVYYKIRPGRASIPFRTAAFPNRHTGRDFHPPAAHYSISATDDSNNELICGRIFGSIYVFKGEIARQYSHFAEWQLKVKGL